LVHLVSVFLMFGLALHGTPVAYVAAMRNAAKQTGPNRLAAHSFLVPSGGGHRAVQGPFVVPAAVALHASVSATAMAVAMGEDVSNMPRPFWSAFEGWILAVEMDEKAVRVAREVEGNTMFRDRGLT
jgi:short-chain fatty acids transporter